MKPLSPNFYRLCQVAGHFTFFCTMNLRTIRLQITQRDGPFILAVTHLGNVEPFLISAVVNRPVDFIARIEFCRYRILAWMLRQLNAIKVNREGVAANAVRTAIDRLRGGRVVGIFPEGGVSRGDASVCLGGPIKLGVAHIAGRAGVPIIPCVILGSHELNRVKPWLPFKRAHVWMAFGEPIPPLDLGHTRHGRKAACAAMGRTLQSAMMSLYRELRDRYDLPEMTGDTYSERATASRPPHRRPLVQPEQAQSAA